MKWVLRCRRSKVLLGGMDSRTANSSELKRGSRTCSNRYIMYQYSLVMKLLKTKIIYLLKFILTETQQPKYFKKEKKKSLIHQNLVNGSLCASSCIQSNRLNFFPIPTGQPIEIYFSVIVRIFNLSKSFFFFIILITF